jgi:hypothetical protein
MNTTTVSILEIDCHYIELHRMLRVIVGHEVIYSSQHHMNIYKQLNKYRKKL